MNSEALTVVHADEENNKLVILWQCTTGEQCASGV